MTGNIVARRYAKALFAVAQEQSGKNTPAQYGEDLSRLADLLENAPDLMKIFRNPVFTVEEKRRGNLCPLVIHTLFPMIDILRYGGELPISSKTGDSRFCCPDADVINIFKIAIEE